MSEVLLCKACGKPEDPSWDLGLFDEGGFHRYAPCCFVSDPDARCTCSIGCGLCESDARGSEHPFQHTYPCPQHGRSPMSKDAVKT